MNTDWFEHAEKNRRYLIGVSGGLDSMALLYLLVEKGFTNLIVCHLNHGLRGEESDLDQLFVEETAKRLGCQISVKKIDLLTEIEQTKKSLETAGRNCRYHFFAACAAEFECGDLVLGHHLDDQAETILWNLMRGSSGYRGMQKISQKEALTISRPLLSLRKSELRDWMNQQDFTWREDQTNAINDVARNRIRNELLPLFNEIAKRDTIPIITRAAAIDTELAEHVNLSAKKADVFDPQGRLHVQAIRALPSAIQYQIFLNYLRENQIGSIDQKLLTRCIRLLEPHSDHSVNLPGGSWLRRKEGRIFLKT